jgi:hypothetical protein
LEDAVKGREDAEREVMKIWDERIIGLEELVRREEDFAGKLFREEQRKVKLTEEQEKIKKIKVL